MIIFYSIHHNMELHSLCLVTRVLPQGNTNLPSGNPPRQNSFVFEMNKLFAISLEYGLFTLLFHN